MKRSEALTQIIETLGNHIEQYSGEVADVDAMAKDVLKTIQQMGFLPPICKVAYDDQNPTHQELGVPYGFFYNMNQWEDENEKI